jgi:hypothetical protein
VIVVLVVIVVFVIVEHPKDCKEWTRSCTSMPMRHH